MSGVDFRAMLAGMLTVVVIVGSGFVIGWTTAALVSLLWNL